MKYKQNLHTHSVYCDGKNTLEEMVLSAIDKGFTAIGFSGHSFQFYLPEACMTIESTKEYKREIAKLKEKYKDQIEIYCGLEFDMYSNVETDGYDYMIGSMHFFKFGDKYIENDGDLEEFKETIKEYFDNDTTKLAVRYFDELSHLAEYGNFDILGHFDLITKYIESGIEIDTTSKEYRDAACHALDCLQGKIPYFEVNTGAIGRGYRSAPYPDEFLLDEIKKRGFKPIISSDCHNKDFLDCYFDEAVELLKKHGFKEVYALGKNGFYPIEL